MQNYSPHQLSSINRCRVYLQALSLSDLVSADGRCVMSSAFTGHRLIDRRSTLEWPAQLRPPKLDWLIWSSSLNTLCIGYSLLQPIDMSQIESHQSWFWYMDQNPTLYTTVDSQWECYPLVSSQWCSLRSMKTRYLESDCTPWSSPPPSLSMASVEQGYGGILQATRCSSPIRIEHTPTPSLRSFDAFILSHPLYSFLLADLTMDADQRLAICGAIGNWELVIASDGSFDPV